MDDRSPLRTGAELQRSGPQHGARRRPPGQQGGPGAGPAGPRGARALPYLLAAPAWLWLAAFFIVPMGAMLSLSLMDGDSVQGYAPAWNTGVYAEVWAAHSGQIARSLLYGACATLVCAAVGVPTAYWIAFRGRRKGLWLFLILLPLLVPFVLRMVSWQALLADDGLLLGPLKDLALLPGGARVLTTAPAVVFGLAHTFFPFMVLPVYTVLARVDGTVVEAARDLYAGPLQTLLAVVLPLARPGVAAGAIMVFVPAAADYVTAETLGGAHTAVVGSVIEDRYLVDHAYPAAAALTALVLVLLLAAVIAAVRVPAVRAAVPEGAP